MKPLALILLPLLALSGCDLSMTRQAKYHTGGQAALFPNGITDQSAPTGTVAEGPPDEAPEPPVTPALIARGAERHAIFCQPCHAANGLGDGVIVQRGFPRPPAYGQSKVVAGGDPAIYGVITNGQGVMFPFGGRIPSPDRWAIAAYVRTLAQQPASAAP